MTSSDRRVTGGVDAHGDTHDDAALDERGRRLGTQSFSTDAAGQRALLAWLEQFGELSVIGVESTGSCAAGLCATCALTWSRSSKSTGRTPTRTPAGQERPDRRRDAARQARDQLSQRKTTRGKATLCSRLCPRTNRLADPPRPPSSHCAHSRGASQTPPSCSGSLPATPANCSSPRGRTLTAPPTTAPSRRPLRRQPDPGLLRACKTSSRSPTASASSTSGSLTPRSKRVRGRLSAYAKALESIAELQENVARAVSSTGSRRSPPPRRLHAGPGRGVHRRGPQAGQVTARTAPGSSVAAEEPGAPARPRKRLRWAAQRVRLSAGDRPARP
jgi:hypothetical protein